MMARRNKDSASAAPLVAMRLFIEDLWKISGVL
jgi:hypothetical protein